MQTINETNTNTQVNNKAIDISQLRFNWGEKNILNIDTWQLNQGERCFIYGRSGTGKSTLLNIIAGMLQAQQGNILVFGHDLNKLSTRQRDRFRAKNMGVIFQQFNLLPYLSVVDNIHLSQHFAKYHIDAAYFKQLLDALELSNALLKQKAYQLSVGQQQRVAVARALIHRPPLIIADEPTSALDEETRDGFMSLLLSLCKQNNSTLLFVSHDKTLAHHFDQQVDLKILNHKEANHAI